MLPTLAAAAGEPDVVEKLKKGHRAGDKTFKVHIDGYNLLPFLKGEVKENPRKGFLYWSDDGELVALRVNHWKVTFQEQRAAGSMSGGNRSCRCVSRRSTTCGPTRSSGPTRTPACIYDKWLADRAFLLVPAQAIVGEFLKTFREFPPRQKPASFSIDDALEKARKSQEVMATAGGRGGPTRDRQRPERLTVLPGTCSAAPDDVMFRVRISSHLLCRPSRSAGSGAEPMLCLGGT